MKLIIAALLIQGSFLFAQEKNCDVRTTGASETYIDILESRGYKVIESDYFDGGYQKDTETEEIKYVNAYWTDERAAKSTYQLNDKEIINSLGGVYRELVFVGDGVRIQKTKRKHLNRNFWFTELMFETELKKKLKDCPYKK